MKNTKIKQFIKASFGNIIEWYDFSLFAYYAVVMGNTFFPKGDTKNSIVEIFLVFGVGFIARPLGGYFLGILGDKFGKYFSISVAIYGMSIASFLIAFIPSYNSIGYASVTLLLFFRLIQGVSAGGQFSGLMAISSEATDDKRSFLAGIAYSVSTIGFLSAICTAYIINLITPESFTNDQWRIAFFISGILGIIYHLLNKKNDTSKKITTNSLTNMKKINIINIIKEQKFAFLGICILVIFQGSMYFFSYSYMYTYLTEILHYSHSNSYIISIVMLCVGCIFYPILGYVADKTNKQVISIIGTIITIPFCFLLIESGNIYLTIIYGIALVICHTAISSGISSITAEVFFPKWRMTGSASSYNIGIAVSGFFPMLCQTSINEYGRNSLIYLVFITVILGLLGHFLIRISKGYKFIT